jgi:hypothetical protein
MGALLVALVPLVFAGLRTIHWTTAVVLAVLLGLATKLVAWPIVALVALPMFVALMVRRRRRLQWRTADLGD